MKALHVVAAVAVVGGVVTSHGGVTNVTAGGPVYGTITQAVAAAGASARLLVSTGLYREAVVISAKTLVIEGGYFATFAGRTNNNACTAVTPPAASSVLTMRNGARVTLDGLLLTGGVALAGGGISVEAGCVLTALNCTVAQNVALGGGGIYADSNSVVVISNSAVASNHALWYGGGVMAYNTARVVVRGPEAWIYGNDALEGAGVYAERQVGLTIEGGAQVFANIAARRGGGIVVADKTAANAGGAIAAVGTSDLACTETSIAGNTATNYGACVFSGMYGGARFDNCLIMSNVARETCGGIFSLMTEPLVLTNGTRLVYNEAGVNAGGVVLVGGRAAVEGSEVAYNRARRQAGGILLFPFGRLTVCDSDVQCNQAEQGGGVYAVGGELRMRALSRACALLRNANVRGNMSRGTASIYGGRAILAGTHSTVEASDCLFEENISSNLGGAISAFGTPRRIAIGSTFSGAPGVLPASQFGGNYARTHGGALCVLGCVETEIANTLMVSNAAGLSGGAILFGESYTGRVVNTIFTRNLAGTNGDAVTAGGAVPSNRPLFGVRASMKVAKRSCKLAAYFDHAKRAAGAARVWLGEALVQEFPAAAWKNGTAKVTNPDGSRATLKIKAGTPPALQLQLVLPDVPVVVPLRIVLGNGAVYAVDVMPDAKGRFP